MSTQPIPEDKANTARMECEKLETINPEDPAAKLMRSRIEREKHESAASHEQFKERFAKQWAELVRKQRERRLRRLGG